MGKSSLIYVIGLSLLVGYGLLHVNEASTESADNYASYFARAAAHTIAEAGASVGTSLLLNNGSSVTDITGQRFNNGTFDVRYLFAGDSATLTSLATYSVGERIYRDTITADFRYTKFSKYGWFTENEVEGNPASPSYSLPQWRITGDSILGPAHTNGKFYLSGSPFFGGKISAVSSPDHRSLNGVDAPVFAAGYEWGVNVPRPAPGGATGLLTSLKSVAQFASSGYVLDKDVTLTFIPDGTVGRIVKQPDGSIQQNDTVAISALASQNVYVVDQGDLHVTGVYKGSLTLVALYSGVRGGNVWIDGNGILAARDPRTDPLSSDVLGLVAENNTFITREDTRTSSSVVTIEAMVYCANGELTAQDYWQLGLQGRLVLYGGVIQNTAGAVGVASADGVLTNGMYYTVMHDVRFPMLQPPSFPIAAKYELASWWEN